MSKILVTGAAGFVGRHTLHALNQRGHTVRAALRKPTDATLVEQIVIGDIDGRTEWASALDGIDGVIHLAARVHVMRETADDPLRAMRTVNTEGTLALAQAAQAAGVKRFVFVSTIGVNGTETPREQPFSESSPVSPTTPYAVSKWEAEQGLPSVHGLETVIVRPPLVYGKGAPGNFAQLTRFVERGLPLPFGWTDNRRSLIAVQNLADFLCTCIEHPAAANQTFLISDGEDVSTTDLLQKVAEASNHPSRLLPFPPKLLRQFMETAGKKQMASQLLGSLVIDSRKAREMLAWKPIVTMDTALRRTIT
ncbi:MAG: NAD-dependent epimerase/dehydratase family protein [Anaerolineae bacterium]